MGTSCDLGSCCEIRGLSPVAPKSSAEQRAQHKRNQAYQLLCSFDKVQREQGRIDISLAPSWSCVFHEDEWGALLIYRVSARKSSWLAYNRMIARQHSGRGRLEDA